MDRGALYRMSRHSHANETTLAQALERWWAALAAGQALALLPGESVPLDQAVGRITAEAVWAKVNSPHYHAAAMDGYAVRAADTVEAQPGQPTYLAIAGQAIPVDTGDPIPNGYDAVIMVEEAHQTTLVRQGQEQLVIEVVKPVAPWHHVRRIGEDIQANSLIVPINHRLRPADIGAIAGAGHSNVKVRRRPRIAILPTGSELVEPDANLQPGDIIEYNSLMLAAAAQEWGAMPTRLPKVSDEIDRIKNSVAAALQTHDLVVVNAGSSAGREDYTAAVFQDLGQIVVQGIAMRPGHPAILAYADVELIINGKPKQVRKALAGIPGYPVSAAVTFEQLIKPLLMHWQGQLMPEAPCLEASLTHAVQSAPDQDEFLRVSLGQVGNRLLATPLTRNAGTIMSLVRADGIIHVARGHSGYAAGEPVTVMLQSEVQQIRNTIIAAGSTNESLEILADEVCRQYPGLRLNVQPLDNKGALLCLQQRQVHLTICHLQDTEASEYSLRFIRQVLPGEAAWVVRFVEKEQSVLVWVIPNEHYADAKIQNLLSVASSQAFKNRIARLIGYKTERSGEKIAQIQI